MVVPSWIVGLSLMVAAAAATTATAASHVDPEGPRDKRTLQLILRGLADALGYEVRPTTTSTPPPTSSGVPPTKPPRMPEPVTDPRMRPPYDVDDLLSYGIKPDSALAQYVRNNAGRHLRQEYERTKESSSSESPETKQQTGSKAEYNEPLVNSIGKVHEYPKTYNRPQATVLSKEARNSSRFFNEPQNDEVDKDTKHFGASQMDPQNEGIQKVNNYTDEYNSGPELEEFGKEVKYSGTYHNDPQTEGFGKENEYSNVFFSELQNKELGKDTNVFGIGVNRSGNFNIDTFGSGQYIPGPIDDYSGLLAYESHSPSKGSELFQNWISSSTAPFSQHYSSYFPSWSDHKDSLQTHENYFQARNDFKQEEEAHEAPEEKPTAPIPAVIPSKNLGALHEMEGNSGHQGRAVPPFDHASEGSVSHLRGSLRAAAPAGPEDHSDLPSSQQQAPVVRRNNATPDDSIQPIPWSYYRYPDAYLPYLALKDSTRSTGSNETSEKEKHSFADLSPNEFYFGKATDSGKSRNASSSSRESDLSPWFHNKDSNTFRTPYEAVYPQGGESAEKVKSTPWSYFLEPVKFLYRNEPNTNSGAVLDSLTSLQGTNDTGVNEKKKKGEVEPLETKRKSKQVGAGAINEEFFNHPEASWKNREVTTERAELVAGRYLGLIVPKFLGLPVRPSNYVYSTKTTMVTPNGGGETRSTEAVTRVSKLHVTGHLSVYPDN